MMPRGSRKPKRDAEIVAMYRTRRHSLRQVGKAFGCSHVRVRQILERAAVPINPPFFPLRKGAAPAGRGAP